MFVYTFTQISLNTFILLFSVHLVLCKQNWADFNMCVYSVLIYSTEKRTLSACDIEDQTDDTRHTHLLSTVQQSEYCWTNGWTEQHKCDGRGQTLLLDSESETAWFYWIQT